MKKTKKMIIFMFAFVLAILMSVPAHADVVSSSKVTATVDSQLQSVLKEATTDERIPVDIWLYESSTVEEREQKIYSSIGINKAQITSNARGVTSSASVDEYITTERAVYASERAEQYASLRLDYSDITALQTTRKTDTQLFYSQYVPMIRAELTSAEIKLMARDDRVQAIYYSPNVTLKDESDVSVPTIDADYTRDTLGYTGSGVKIGMIESGLPDSRESYLTGADITYDNIPNIERRYTDHANKVAAIMVGQPTTDGGIAYKGIVPDAELYATCCVSSEDWRARVEWLISQGVHVINMSAFLSDVNQGHYGTHERWVDHIAKNHHIHFVNSAGNTGIITSPGTAYNILTVGSINDANNINPGNDTIAENSGYMEYLSLNSDGEEFYPTNKPDLMAPGVNITTAAGTDSGTSFAAPHVTAVVAQLCQRQPSLRTLQAGVKAILTASISHGTLAFDTQDGDNYDKMGAGVVNAKEAFETANTYRMSVGSFPANSASGTEKVYTFSVPVDQRVRVSLTWLKHSVFPETIPHIICDPSDIALADLDLYIIDPDGLWINYSSNYYYNTEIVDFTTEKSGTYQMVVINYTPSSEVVEFAIAWWLE